MHKVYTRTPWHDRWVLMHWPRAAFVYCFLLIGAFLSPEVNWWRLALSFVGMFFILQLAAYRLDEMKGRHISTNLSKRELKATVAVGLVGGIAVGIIAVWLEPWMLAWLVVGFMGVVLYNYEIGGFHNMHFFGITWGFAPVIASYWFHAGVNLAEWYFIATPWFVYAWGIFAFVLARLHIWSYGNTRCYHKETCLDYPKTDDCHGQQCYTRVGLRDLGNCLEHLPFSKEIHKLQWHLINLQLYLILVVAAAVVLQHYA